MLPSSAEYLQAVPVLGVPLTCVGFQVVCRMDHKAHLLKGWVVSVHRFLGQKGLPLEEQGWEIEDQSHPARKGFSGFLAERISRKGLLGVLHRGHAVWGFLGVVRRDPEGV